MCLSSFFDMCHEAASHEKYMGDFPLELRLIKSIILISSTVSFSLVSVREVCESLESVSRRVKKRVEPAESTVIL